MIAKTIEKAKGWGQRLKQKTPMVLMLISVGILFGLIFGFKLFQNIMINKYLKSGYIPPVSVTAMSAKFQDWQPKIKAVGSLRAINGIDVTSQITGMITAIHFKPGAEVKAGEVLIDLGAEAELAQLRSLQAAVELAKTVFTRDQAQFKVQAISKASLDADLADLKRKEADMQAQAATVAKKKIVAPFSGRLGISLVNLGQYVNPGDKLVTLQALNPILLNFYVPQQNFEQLSVGQIVTIKSDSDPDQIFSGEITTIDPKVDPATRNVQVQATISNTEYKLLPGMYAALEVQTGEPKRYLTLPQTAISYNPYGDLIYIINSGSADAKGEKQLTVKQSFVTLGETRGDQVAVLSGIRENDQVVTSGQLKLKNGSAVFINNAVTPSNDAAPKPRDE